MKKIILLAFLIQLFCIDGYAMQKTVMKVVEVNKSLTIWDEGDDEDTGEVASNYSVKLSVKDSSAEVLNVLSDKQITVDVTVEDDSGNKITNMEGWEIISGFLSKEEITNELGLKGLSCEFTLEYKEGSGEYSEQEFTLNLRNKNDNKEYTSSLIFHVYPQPKITNIDIDPKKTNQYSIGETVTLTAIVSGGYSDGWTYQWKNNNEDIPESDSRSIRYTLNQETNNIVVEATNTDPDNKTWINADDTKLTVGRIVLCMSDAYGINFELSPNTYNLLNDSTCSIKVILKKGEEVINWWEEGWTAEWDGLNNEDGTFEDGTFTYKAENTGEDVKVETLTLTLKNNNVPEDKWPKGTITFNVYPTPTVEFYPDQLKDLYDSSETVTLRADDKGGYSEGWSFSWIENGNTICTDKECIIEYKDDGVYSRNISVCVTNKGPEGEVWYSETKHFTINFKKPQEYVIEFEELGEKDVIYTLHGKDTTLTVKLIQKEDGEEDKEIEWYNDNDWNAEWDPNDHITNNDDGTFTYSAENTGVGAKEEKLTLMLKKDDEIVQKEITFYVYHTPIVKFNPDPLEDLYDSGDEVTLKVSVDGGNPEGWSYSWKEKNENNKETTDSSYTVRANDKYQRIIIVKVKNVSPDGIVWCDTTYTYDINFRIPIEYSLEVKSDEKYLLDGCETEVHLTLKMKNGKTKEETVVTNFDGWTITWDPNSLMEGKDGKYYFKGKYQGNKDICEQTLKITFEKNDTILSKEISISIVPKPIVKNDKWMSSEIFKDLNNPSNDLQKGIREGNGLELPKPQNIMKINHDWDGYVWEYVWKYKGAEVENSIVPTNSTEDIETIKIDCYARYKKGKDVMWEGNVGTKELKVYKKPTTPNYFMQKGDGTSGTWIVSGYPQDNGHKDKLYLGEYNSSTTTEVRAIQSVNVNNSGNDIGWFILQGYKDKNDLCIYTVRDYGDNVIITSDILPINASSIPWDGSTYEVNSSHTRNTSGIVGTYSIDGVKKNALARGLNIIRLEDGTVRKVFKK